MVSLLVNRNCMESLRKDITDLQGTVISVFSHAGAVRFPSWKFPDKVSCDLDLVALMGQYDFVENDPEFTQHSHVVLLELVIDRLLLLLQSFTGYTESLMSEEAVPPSRAVGPSMSVGLTVRKYWNSMLKLGALYQKMVAEKKYTKDASNLKSSFRAMKAENEHLKSVSPESDVTLPGFQSSLLTSSAGSRLLDNALSARSDPSVNLPGRSVHSQTIESCLVPCDACESTQVSLQEVGKAIINICSTLNISSSLGKFLKMVEERLGGKLLTAMDVSYWATEQSKDLSRISKHIQMLMGLINPLKGELEEFEKQKNELKQQLENLDGCLQKEKEAKKQQRMETEQLLQKKERESQQLMAKLQKAKEDLGNRAVSLEMNLSTLKEKLQAQESTIQELEQARKDLQQEMESKMVDKDEVDKREEQLKALSSQLERVEQQLNWTTLELNKERARGDSMLQHQESLQAKQQTLMQQLDSLDQECEQLKTSMADGEDDRQMMRERLKEVQEEKWEIQGRLEAQKDFCCRIQKACKITCTALSTQKLTEKLKQEKQSLEQSSSELQRTISELGELIHEMKEKEKLLVFFPDLHLPVETQFETSGNVMEDMGKQLQANNIRISILEEENARLRNAIGKMKEPAQQEMQKDTDRLTGNSSLRSLCFQPSCGFGLPKNPVLRTARCHLLWGTPQGLASRDRSPGLRLIAAAWETPREIGLRTILSSTLLPPNGLPAPSRPRPPWALLRSIFSTRRQSAALTAQPKGEAVVRPHQATVPATIRNKEKRAQKDSRSVIGGLGRCRARGCVGRGEANAG